MAIELLVPGVLLVAIGATHSALGERYLLGPLCAAPHWPATPLGERAAKRILRFAWHLTTLAWAAAGFGVAALAFDGGDLAGNVQLAALTLALLATGAVVYGVSRGAHLAWPAFAAAGLMIVPVLAPRAYAELRHGIGVAGGALLLAIAAWHFYWAAGGRRGLQAAVPRRKDGTAVLAPRAVASALAGAAIALAGSVFWMAIGWLPAPLPGPALRIGLAAMAAIFALRLIGDFRYVGLFKRVRGTEFGRRDDAIYGPLLFFWATGAGAVAVAGP